MNTDLLGTVARLLRHFMINTSARPTNYHAFPIGSGGSYFLQVAGVSYFLIADGSQLFWLERINSGVLPTAIEISRQNASTIATRVAAVLRGDSINYGDIIDDATDATMVAML